MRPHHRAPRPAGAPAPAPLPTLPPLAPLAGAMRLRLGCLALLSLALRSLPLPGVAEAVTLLTGLGWWGARRRAARRSRRAKQAYDAAFAQYLAFPADWAICEQA